MKEYIIKLADYVYNSISNNKGNLKNRLVNCHSTSGDAQFNIDILAENSVLEFVFNNKKNIAIFTEEKGLIKIDNDPEYILIIDPIDGTRPFAAGLEMSCISIAVAEYKEDAGIKDIKYALLKELKSGYYIYGDYTNDKIIYEGYPFKLPNLSNTKQLKNMFWSIEFNGHPSRLMIDAYGHLIDLSANNGGIFVFNSASYSISRIITGQLDAYVDIGNRLLKDDENLLDDFKKVGNGNILHLFPYDIAASVFLAEKTGMIITDAYGKSLDDTLLMDLSYKNQQSCIAASNEELHTEIIKNINWKIK